MFVGTFTAGGLEVEIKNKKLKILKEGRNRKFTKAVEQITFNGSYAAEQQKDILYVTERCVFRLVKGGLHLIEIAPGIDLKKDILDQMDFEPIVDKLELMDARIFADSRMKLGKQLLDIPLKDRMVYDKPQNIVFVNLSGLLIESDEELSKFEKEMNKFFSSLETKVNLISNYDGISIAPRMAAKFTNVLGQLEYDYYLTATRYTTSAFLRQKLGQDLKNRSISPHIFETRQEAADYILGSQSD